MNLERTKPETLAAGVMDYMPQSLAAHEYAERLNAALARLGLTDRLTLPSAPATAIDELPGVVDVPLRKTLSVLMGKAEQGDASALATLEMTAQVMESIFAGLHARASVYPLALPSDESLATLSQGVDALLPRKISTGWSVASLLADPTCDGIDDGVSLVRLLCSSIANTITELIDDNIGWVMSKAVANAFPNAKKVILGCKTLHASPSSMLPNAEEFDFPYLDHIDTSEAGHPQINLFYGASIKRINMPALERFRCVNASYKGVFYNLTSPCEILMPNCTSFDGQGGSTYPVGLHTVTGLTKMVLGTLTNVCNPFRVTSTPINLIHFEIGQGTSCSVNLQYWTPTNAMAENLDVFLSNFRLYIADRLSGDGSGKTLTLSQAVRDAIQQDPEIVSIITSKGWTISPAPSV